MEHGLSSAILGLGIAIDLDLYKEIFYKDSLGGFDKRLQIQLVQKVKQIGFAKDCIVYEDADMGLIAAQRAGMRAIDVRILWQ